MIENTGVPLDGKASIMCTEKEKKPPKIDLVWAIVDQPCVATSKYYKTCGMHGRLKHRIYRQKLTIK
jgi:hypothetical protein